MSDEGAPSAEALALLDTAPCGLLQTLDNGQIVRANRTFCRWVGRTADELVGRRLTELLTMGGRIFHQTHWEPLLRMQGSLSEVKLEVLHRDGSVIPMVLNATRQQQGGRTVHEISTYVARDRDKYERELVRSRKRLEELVAESNRLHSEAKDRALFAEQMIGIVSHDLRNPLNGIGMAAGLLARGELTVAQQNVLNRLSRSTERANRLIADLLDFTQARVGKGISVTRSSIDLHEVVSESVDELSLLYPKRTIEHVRRGEGSCSADGNRLAQLIGNLVSNAMTYGDPDAPVVATSTLAATSFSIAIHNQGEPIPEATRARIFEPMTRGTSDGSAARSVGLGLYIVREIAKAHGGDASVTSTRDGGTTFSAHLPRQGVS